MQTIIDQFFKAYTDWTILYTVYSAKYLKEMLTSAVDSDGWVGWRPISGTLQEVQYPIRAYDHEYMGSPDGLTEIIFSSFSKLLECLTHYMVEIKSRPNFEIVPEFFRIDPSGAGKTGLDYWLGWAGMQRDNFEEFGS